MSSGSRTFVAFVLMMYPVFGAAAPAVSGIIRDSSGAAVPGAEVEIRSSGGELLAVKQTDDAGRFEWTEGYRAAAHYQFRVTAGGLAAAEVLLYLAASADQVEILLHPRSIFTRIVVNATRGNAEESTASAHLAVIKDSEDIVNRPLATLGNVLEQEPGIHLQQSTYGQVSPFLRGLTGYQVLNIIDGIRFNNSTFRSGPNQYLAFIDPFQAERVEATLGPTGSQYGSDSLGGTIQVLTPDVRFPDSNERQLHGAFILGGASADLSGHAAARVSVADRRYYWLAGISGRSLNDLRAGRGHDSHNVYHRLFGMSLPEVREFVGSRQQDSAFSQYGLQAKFSMRPRQDQLLTVHYQRSQQYHVRGYKDLLGGLGRLLSDFEPQGLDWFYTRYEKTNAGILDSLVGTFSLNSQTDGSRRQNLHFTDPYTRDYVHVNAFGYAGQATAHRGRRLIASFGGEFYDERIDSEREVWVPTTGALARPRPLYPDGSLYQNLGIYAQGSFLLSSRLQASGGVRWTSTRFKTRANPSAGVPESSRIFRDLTFHSSLGWHLAGPFGLHGVVSRGFRAPNLNDLGAIGLNDLGYEIPAAETIQAGALLSTDAGEGAVSRGVPLKNLSAESLMNYEFGMRVTTGRLSARAQCFDAELYDPIVRRTALFPAASVPTELAGLPVAPLPPTAAQQAQGVVAVSTALDPRAVKAFVNDGRARYYGLETLVRYALRSSWTVEANYAYILGRELNPNRNIRRLPPQAGSALLRYVPSGRRPWFELSLSATGRQERLSGGDRDDERIGASFRRRDIADFFNGDRVTPYLRAGVFSPTGETLQQIQDRVLPIGAIVNGVLIVDDSSRVPLYLSTPGWSTVGIRSGIQVSESWMLCGGIENLLDHNYRYHGSGIDAPGRTVYLTLSYRF